MPTEAIRQARTMKTRKLPPSSVLSEVRASTSSQTTASEGDAARRLLGPVGGVGELRVDLLERDRAVAGDRRAPCRSLDDHAGVLAGDVAEDHVALGLAGGAGEEDQVADRGRRLEQVEDLLGSGLRGRRSAGGPWRQRIRAPGSRDL